MKLNSIVATLCIAACAPAFADPFVPNAAAPSPIGSPPAGEASLQSIADSLYGPGSINVNTGQSSAGMFTSSSPSFASSIPTLVAEFTANQSTQAFGIWFGTNTSNVVGYDLLLGGATAGSAVGMTINGNTLNVFGPSGCGSAFNCGSFSNALVNSSSFGFYFRASPSSPTYYTLDQLNTGSRTDRVVSYQNGSSTNWMFAYEDGADFDYNDMVVKVESIAAPVPEPETYALMMAGLGALGFISRRRKAAA